MAYLHALTLEEAPFRHRQEDILRFMVDEFKPQRKERLMLESAFAGSGIDHRSSVLPDFSIKYGQRTLFKDAQDPAIEERMGVYVQEGEKFLVKATKHALTASGLPASKITHLVVFSCTGLVNPGLESYIMHACDLPASVETHGIYFAGCHGAFKAIKMANMLAESAGHDANVLVAGLELCTLHFIPGRTGDQIRANTIFADGSAGFLVSRQKPDSGGYCIGGTGQEIIRTPTPLMSWNVGAQAFFMTLSSKIDKALNRFNLPTFIDRVQSGFEGEVVCHPGGRSILDTVKNQLQPRYTSTLSSSYETLRTQGNMSSITILHVLRQEFDKATKQILALGFGPGLTIEGLHLQAC